MSNAEKSVIAGKVRIKPETSKRKKKVIEVVARVDMSEKKSSPSRVSLTTSKTNEGEKQERSDGKALLRSL